MCVCVCVCCTREAELHGPVDPRGGASVGCFKDDLIIIVAGALESRPSSHAPLAHVQPLYAAAAAAGTTLVPVSLYVL